MSYISDFHTHLGLKKANNENIEDLWKYHRNEPPSNFLFFFNLFRIFGLNAIYKTYATYTQCNLDNCVEGDLRLVVCSLYPIERPYIKRRNFPTALIGFLTIFTKTFPWFRIFDKKKNFLTSLVRILVVISQSKAVQFWDEQNDKNSYVDYFSDYKNEFDQLFAAQNSSSKNDNYKNKSFRLVKDYADFKQKIKDPNIICGILSLEGLHGLGTYRVEHLFSSSNIDEISVPEKQKLLKSLSDNINEVKQHEYMTPFYITLSHHFNNLICGHCQSFTGVMTLFFKQKGGMNGPLSDIGRQIINRLLERKGGFQRILIDIKHMSIETRKSYYQIVRALRIANDNVPIISSHSAVNGVKLLSEAKKTRCDKKINKSSYISKCDINLTDEDIVEIFDSGGLIGILMHDGRMPGDVYKKTFKKTKDIKERMLLQQQLFLSNIYHIIQVIKIDCNKNGWDIITLGSDMDGLIDPFDDYKVAGKLQAFRNDIYKYLDEYDSLQDDQKLKDLYSNTNGSVHISFKLFNELNQGLSIKDIVDKIFYKNLENFLGKYFTKSYLFNETN